MCCFLCAKNRGKENACFSAGRGDTELRKHSAQGLYSVCVERKRQRPTENLSFLVLLRSPCHDPLLSEAVCTLRMLENELE